MLGVQLGYLPYHPAIHFLEILFFFQIFSSFSGKNFCKFLEKLFSLMQYCLCNHIEPTQTMFHQNHASFGNIYQFYASIFQNFLNFLQCLYFFRFMKCFFILSPLNATASRRHKRILSLDRSDVSGMLDSIKPMFVQLSSPCWGSFDAFDQKFCVSAV